MIIDGDRCRYFPNCMIHDGSRRLPKQRKKRMFSDAEVLGIREAKWDFTSDEVALQYGCSRSTILKIWSRVHYAEVE
jgi:hypothetical protein